MRCSEIARPVAPGASRVEINGMSKDEVEGVEVRLSRVDRFRLERTARRLGVSLNDLFVRMTRDFLAGIDEEDTE